ncbi:MAG: FadR family transcriptional regulator [Clostridia bacterium]|nr:FadR family transcriptional regulator [Clostridia bacterium]
MEKIKRSNLVDEVYKQLLGLIASGDYPEGSRIPSEPQLCEMLGVSRNTVRTAISKLIALGILENQQGYGNCVRSMNIGLYANSILPCMLSKSTDLIAATEYRIGVETMAATLAAERATDEDIARLFDACEQAEKHINSVDEFAQYDMLFHRIVAEASRNPLFIRTSEMIEAMYTTWLIGFQRTHGMDKSHDYHIRICKAIAAHDPKEAGRSMQEHLEHVLSNIRKDLVGKDGIA